MSLLQSRVGRRCVFLCLINVGFIFSKSMEILETDFTQATSEKTEQFFLLQSNKAILERLLHVSLSLRFVTPLCIGQDVGISG
ncbi:hypothetical protein EJ04DRAFT_90435 [Polyplosphaeria fusca]|uniref:Uncharacterized protein n=1 Tax=Polyplosphaeria fusca TaxID=682080 RepID=A0A9P4QPM6_9PLEO|nr:hypothetical protein EJ04DRAFT_90435 [Polyplosphaeria fusca]